jgi:hypothetical protein
MDRYNVVLILQRFIQYTGYFLYKLFLSQHSITLSPTAPSAPPYLMALGLICPNKIRADVPEGHELRATAIAALSLRVSLLYSFFPKFNTLEYNFYI